MTIKNLEPDEDSPDGYFVDFSGRVRVRGYPGESRPADWDYVDMFDDEAGEIADYVYEGDSERSWAMNARPDVSMMTTAIDKNHRTFEVEMFSPEDMEYQMWGSHMAISDLFDEQLEEYGPFKFRVSVRVSLVRQLDVDMMEFSEAFYDSPAMIVMSSLDFCRVVEATKNIMGKFSKHVVVGGTGWALDRIRWHRVSLVNYTPLRGTSYLDLPPELRGCKSVVNIRNSDDRCFLWCHLAMLKKVKKNPQRVSNYEGCESEVDYEGVKFPVTISGIGMIERKNNVSVNVFSFGGRKDGLFPVRVSDGVYDAVLNLLLIKKGDVSHYVLISDFNKFMYRSTKHKCRKFYCMRCLQRFGSESRLAKHTGDCIAINGVQPVTMPQKGSVVKYRGHSKEIDVAFVVYADFESILRETVGNIGGGTSKINQHVCCGFAFKVVCKYDGKFTLPVEVYRGEDSIGRFLKRMVEVSRYCTRVRRSLSKNLSMSREEVERYESTEKCYVCGDGFTKKEFKIRGYCKGSGRFVGGVHERCQKEFVISNRIPVVFHNLRGYDSHFLMQEIGKMKMKINVIPNNMERYMAIMLGDDLCFIDSFQFMGCSLARLAGDLSDEKLRYTGEEYNGDEFALMRRKGVYPYDYMNSFERMDEASLPPKEAFFNRLTGSHVEDSEYEHAQKVWDAFGTETMGEYHDLYLKTDVLLLADIFESFRCACRDNYGLDPCHYFTSPGLAWDAMLKMTGVSLDLIHKVDMNLFVGRALRGGICNVATRYAAANNKYMHDFDESKESSYIMYLDANNLYGAAMSEFLPFGGFRWLKKEELSKFTVDSLEKYTETSCKGAFLEVDLEYPKELHDLHNEYPLAPERGVVTDDMLSDYCKDLKKKTGASGNSCSKLLTTLYDKNGYVVHHTNLKLYLSLGMKVKRVVRVLEFDQSPWLRQFIAFNTGMRTLAKGKFLKDFFKLMNNAVYGKTLEDVRKRVKVNLVTNENQLALLVNKPTFVKCKVFNGSLVAVHSRKTNVVLNRPIYVGATVLDLSKAVMYRFHYNYIKARYPRQSTLLFTDTDSLMYKIRAEDVYEDFMTESHRFDNSGYDKGSPFYYSFNEKVIGKMKDEAGGRAIREFVGLRPKMYAFSVEGGGETKKAKGVDRSVVKREIKIDLFRRSLFGRETFRHTSTNIVSVSHELFTVNRTKKSLCAYNDKVYILRDGVSSLSYGNHRIPGRHE